MGKLPISKGEPYLKRRQSMNEKGFSLMEIMIVVVIVGILAAVAIPAYTGYMTRTRRAEAITALETVALYEEKNFALSNQYDTLANIIANQGLLNPNADANRNYDVGVSVRAGGAGFVAEARPVAGSPQDGDLVFAIDNNGNRGTLNGTLALGNVAADNQLWNSLRK
jgi:type IV pilus assembly protein PilE